MPRRLPAHALAALATLVLVAPVAVAAQKPEPPAGMSAYVMVFLKKAPGSNDGPVAGDEKLMADHLASLRALAISGDAVAVGPTADGGDIRGIIIFRDMPVERARRLAEADPLVRAGRHVVEAHPWWGPAGIGKDYSARAKATPLDQLPFVTYQIGFLRRPADWTPLPPAEAEKMQEAHMAHIVSMHEAGKLVAAGPFTDDGTLRGVFLFKSTAEEASALASDDPLVHAKRLEVDLHPWMTSEGVIP